MSISSPAAKHRLLSAVARVEAVLDGVVGVDPLYLSTTQKQELLVGLTRVLARVAGMRAQVLAVADDLAAVTSNRSAGTWLATQTRTSIREAVHDERLGTALRDRWTQTSAAVGSGVVTWEQAAVITRAMEALPSDLDAELVAKAEAHLIGEAGHFGPRDLTRLGRRVLEVIAPDLADAAEEQALRAAEERAHAATRLTFKPRHDGTTDLYARLPDHVASRLKAYLDAHTAPRKQAAISASQVDPLPLPLPLPRARGEAFCTLLEHIPTHALPQHGGVPTTIVVTLDYNTLLSGVGLAETSTGDTLTAGQARRLACTAAILPAVLNGPSQVLDLGRTRRLFTPAQRKALALRDKTCRADGCTIPAAWCEAHHTQPWARGGPTNLDHGVLLCSFHHHRAHDHRYEATRKPHGDLTFTRRT